MTDTPETIAHETTYDAMLAVMREVGFITKDRKYEGQGGYKFRGIEELLTAVGPAFRRHGVIPVTRVVGEPVLNTYVTGKNQTEMHRALVHVEVEFCAQGPGTFTAGAWGEAADAGDKAVAKAYSVAWREIMFKTFAVPTSGDDYDPERAGDSVNAGPAWDGSEQGWTSLEDLEKAWATMRDTTKALPEGVASDNLAKWAKAQKFTKGTFTAAQYGEWSQRMEGVNAETGDYAEGYEPFE
jgi:ERF superfamily